MPDGNEDEDLVSDKDDELMSEGDVKPRPDRCQVTPSIPAGQSGLIFAKNSSLPSKIQPVLNSTGSLQLPPHMKRLTQVQLTGQVTPCNRQDKQDWL